jgi:hypothetical protein
MVGPLLIPKPQKDKTIEKTEPFAEASLHQTAPGFRASQVPFTGTVTKIICNILLVIRFAFRNWINHFNRTGTEVPIGEK